MPYAWNGVCWRVRKVFRISIRDKIAFHRYARGYLHVETIGDGWVLFLPYRSISGM